MKSLLNQNIIDKYILDEFGNIPNPPTKDKMIALIYDDNLTLERVKLWSLFGGDLMIKTNYGKTILHSASKMGQLDIVQFVLDKEVNVDSLNNHNKTPLLFAILKSQVEVINLLLERGANINHQDNDRWSVLHYASDWNYLDMVKLLIKNGIDIHLKNNNNETALNIAEFYKYQQIIDYLTPFYNNN